MVSFSWCGDVLDPAVVAAASDDPVARSAETIDDGYRYASRLAGGDRDRTDDLVEETSLGVFRRLRHNDRLELSTGYRVVLIVACRSRFIDEMESSHRRSARQRTATADLPASAATTEPPPPREFMCAIAREQP